MFFRRNGVKPADLTEKDANAGLKSAMEQGSIAAVNKLGVADGF